MISRNTLSMMAMALLIAIICLSPWVLRSRSIVTPLARHGLQQLDGKPIHLDTWPQSWVLVNVWSPDCAPCAQELPMLARFDRRHGKQIAVLGVSPLPVDENMLRARAAVAGVNYPLAVDTHGWLEHSMGKPVALPTSYLLNHQRHVVWRHEGSLDSPAGQWLLQQTVRMADGAQDTAQDHVPGNTGNASNTK